MLRIMLISVCLLAFTGGYAQVAQQDSLALVALYNSTGGNSWVRNTNWLTANPVAGWYGVTVNANRVTKLNLTNNNLTGSIPSELGNLSALVSLSLGSNKLTGLIPVELGNLTALTVLRLGSNSLSGSIPGQIGQLVNLDTLFLPSNQLSGTIPDEIGQLTHLKNLVLGYNQLTGSIPSQIGNLTSLTYLSLRSNKLTGSIPQELCQCTQIVNLYLDADSLSGEIPSGIGNFTNCVLFYLNSNQLTGEIPSSIGTMSSVQEIYLGSNHLQGEIPSTVGNLSNLRKLFIAGNQLSGPIPSTISNCNNLQQLYLGENQLSGQIPSTLGNLSSLTRLSLPNNQLQSPIPTNLANLDILISLILSHNQFTDLIDMHGLSALTSCNVEYNKLTFEDIENSIGVGGFDYTPQDSVGSELFPTLTEGQPFTLSVSVGGTANQYQWMKNSVPIAGATGTTFTINAIAPEDSGIYNCMITNTICIDLILYSRPTALTVIPLGFFTDSLALIQLYNATNGLNWTDNTNWLSGNELSSWFGVTITGRRVTELLLPFNNLDGKIVEELGNLSKLTRIDLSGNKLSDTVPSSIVKCADLAYFDLSNNALDGTFPALTPALNKLYYLALDSNRLDGLPDLSSLSEMDTLLIHANRFTFEDIEPQHANDLFIYAPQDSIGIAQSLVYYKYQTFVLGLRVGGSANQYQWMKNGVSITDATGDTLVVPDLKLSDSGTYICEITSVLVPGLSIYSRGAHIAVNDTNYTPAIDPIADTGVMEKQALTLSVHAEDYDEDVIQLSTGVLPGGAVFIDNTNGNGLFSWTPEYDQAGAYTILFIASDTKSSDTETVVITIGNVNRGPVMTGIPDTTVNEGQSLSFTISATDPDGDPLTYETENLPSGALFNPSMQQFTWTPTYDQSGIYTNILFIVTDGDLSDTETITLIVNNVNRAPVFSSTEEKSVTENQELQFVVSAFDPDGNQLNYSAESLPAGSIFNAVTHTFTWTPDYSQAGTYTPVRFMVTDGMLSDTLDMTIIVFNTNRPPALSSVDDTTALTGQHIAFTVSTNDPDSDPVQLIAQNLPAGAQFTLLKANSGLFTWTPTESQAATWHVTFLVTDGLATVSKDVKIVVDNSVDIQTVDPQKSNWKVQLLRNPVALNSGKAEIGINVLTKSEARIVILDPVGNMVHQARFDVYPAGSGFSTVYRWDLKTCNGRKVVSGSYLAVIFLKSRERIERIKRIIAVK